MRLTEDQQERLGSNGWGFYSWHDDPSLARFMFSFRVEPWRVQALLRDMEALSKELGLYPLARDDGPPFRYYCRCSLFRRLQKGLVTTPNRRKSL